MQTLILIIGVIRKGDSVLLRKKPEGSPPYSETWYLFGGEVSGENTDPDQVLVSHVKKTTGVDIQITERLGWDTEIKPDHEGIMTNHIYLDCLAEYVGGELVLGEGIEKIEWVPIEKLHEYDLVPPSVKLFKKLKYI
jgi:ADP-ribose pyrophosphatase YjhB (NUDIX family)